MLYLEKHKKRVNTDKEIAAGTLRTLYRPIKVFCEMHDLDQTVHWKRITRGLQKAKDSANDRAYTTIEIQKLVKFADQRLRAIVYVTCSTGIRSGAWDGMKWRHVTPKYDKQTGDLIAAKLEVYDNDGEEYYTFMTPEADNVLKEYMDFRASYGEQITRDSPLIRNSWRTVDIVRGGGEKAKRGGRNGLVTCPKPISHDAIELLVSRALKQQHIRGELPEGERRHEFKAMHGFRKFFNTKCKTAGMVNDNVEFMIGHRLPGSQGSYWRPETEDVALEDYLKAVPVLTIHYDKDKSVLQEQVAEIREKHERDEYAIDGIKGRLAEKEKENEETKKELKDVREEISLLKRGFNHLIETGVMEPILRQSADTDR
jgi:hypothetical protein